jgi:16S rRNA (adenine1518-N6/adenine1519-N6)-dimethyltransferase
MELKAKKSLGQHFLRSERALSDIVDAGDISADDIVLEVGPGEGVLTERLFKLAKKVIAVEKDPRSVALICEKFADEIKRGKLEVVEADILEFNPRSGSSRISGNYKVIANIPYYITGAILEHFLQSDFQPERMVLLVQKEVARRIVARPTSPKLRGMNGKESILSMSVKVYGDPKIISIVPKGAFVPPPTVDSAVILIGNISKDRLGGVDDKFFFSVLKAGFAHKRKKLIKNLEEITDATTLSQSFKSLTIDENTRAEDLTLPQWIAIAKKLSEM